jgi:hypothetical protein
MKLLTDMVWDTTNKICHCFFSHKCSVSETKIVSFELKAFVINKPRLFYKVANLNKETKFVINFSPYFGIWYCNILHLKQLSNAKLLRLLTPNNYIICNFTCLCNIL